MRIISTDQKAIKERMSSFINLKRKKKKSGTGKVVFNLFKTSSISYQMITHKNSLNKMDLFALSFVFL